MTDNSGQFVYINGDFFEYDDAVGKTYDLISKIENSKTIIARIYEVVRFIDGVPIFWEEHVDRLRNSLRAYNESFYVDTDLLRGECCNLLFKSGLVNCNVQLTFYINEQCQIDKITYIKQHFYPTIEMYENGVDTDIVHISRENPSIKNWVPEYKAAVKAAMGDNFEVLLTNENNEILEGSRSNFFYVKEGNVYTSPHNLVLNGITRINILRAIENCGFTLIEKSLSVLDIINIDGAFISGTSLNVLPIRRIGSIELIKNNDLPEVIREIMLSFERILNKYVYQNKLSK